MAQAALPLKAPEPRVPAKVPTQGRVVEGEVEPTEVGSGRSMLLKRWFEVSHTSSVPFQGEMARCPGALKRGAGAKSLEPELENPGKKGVPVRVVTSP